MLNTMKNYSTDLTDNQWQRLDFFRFSKKKGNIL